MSRAILARRCQETEGTQEEIRTTVACQYSVDIPAAGFEGIRHVDGAFGDPKQFVELPDPAGICLSGIPPYRQLREDIRVPPPPGKTFCLVASTKCEIWNWFWIVSDPVDEQLPIDWDKRFDRQVWPKQKR